MEKIKSFFKNNWLNLIILISFSVIVLFISPYHEHWADEAQSWLISRDLSFTELISYTKYEGTPPLWCILLQSLIKLGLDYSHFYLVSAILTIIGVGLVLFKVKLPWYIKVLFPFSYYILFQSSMISRSYSLILPVGTLLYLSYKNRFDKPFLFTFLLFIFMNISMHTYIIAGSIYAIYIYDSIKLIKKDKTYFKKILINNILLFILFFIILIVLMPNSNFGFGGSAFEYTIFQIFGEITFSSGNQTIIEYIACAVLLAYSIMIFSNHSLEYFLKTIIIIVPLIIFLIVIYCMPHHFITAFYLMLLFFILNIDKKETKILLTIILILQATWGFKTVIYDYNKSYDAASYAAEFIKEISNENTKIYGINFHTVSIQPYFDSNIYNNYLGDDQNNAFYSWKLNHNYIEIINKDFPDICVLEITTGDDINEANLAALAEYNVNRLLENNYECYAFYKNGQYYKDHDSTTYNFLVFVSPELSQTVDNSRYSKFTLPENYFSDNDYLSYKGELYKIK